MKLKLIEKIINNQTVTFVFQSDITFSFKPGQFLRYHIPNTSSDERGENRFFSISSAPFEKVVKLITKFAKVSSTFKKDLQKIKTGDIIEAFGPSGSFTIEDPSKPYVFIAGGIGITPFRSILLDFDHQDKSLNITLLYANRSKDILFQEELEALAKKHPEFKVYYIISEEPATEEKLSQNVKIVPGKIDESIIKSLIINLQSLIFFISGPEPMVISFTQMLTRMGVAKENIKRDEFPGYNQF